MAQVFGSCDFDAANLREVGFERPTEKTGEAACLILKLPRAFEVLKPLINALVKPDHHRCRGLQASVNDRPLCLEVLRHGVLEL